MPIVSAGVMCRARRSTKTQSVGWQSRRRKLCRRLCFNSADDRDNLPTNSENKERYFTNRDERHVLPA